MTKLWSSRFPTHRPRANRHKLLSRDLCSHRGISLIEVLLALGLLLIVASIGVLSSTTLLHQQRFESSLDLVREQLASARLHARRTSTMIEVVYETDTNSILARVFLLTDQEDQGAEDHLLEQKRWSRHQLDASVRLTQSQGNELANILIDDMSFDPQEIVTSQAGTTWSLVTFLPSGGCANFAETYLEDQQGRRAALSVEPLTGHVRWTRVDDGQTLSAGELEFEDHSDQSPELASADTFDRNDLPQAQRTNVSGVSDETVYP